MHGNARCTTCRVEILAGDFCEASANETCNDGKGIEDHLRLSCQMRVHKDIVVRPVLTVENSGLDAGPRPADKAMNLKQLAGEYAANFVNDGMKIGLGTGSTVY